MADQAISAIQPTTTVVTPAPAPQPVQTTPTTATPTLTDIDLHAAAQGLSAVVGGGQPASSRLVLIPYAGHRYGEGFNQERSFSLPDSGQPTIELTTPRCYHGSHRY